MSSVALPVLAYRPEPSRAQVPFYDHGGEAPPVTIGTITEVVRGNRFARRLPNMSYMELMLTDQCNLRCSYCFEQDKNPHNMSAETACAAVDFLIKQSGNVQHLIVLFFGGEPLLRFDLIRKIVAYTDRQVALAGKTVGYDMTTNGTLITETMLHFFRKHGIKFLLSMDGGRQDHDRYRRFPGGRGSFDCIARNLPLMKRYQPWMGVKMSVAPDTVQNLRSNIEALFQLGINQFIVGYAHGIPWTVADLACYEAAMREVCELYLEMKYYGRYFRMTFFEEGEPGQSSAYPQFGCGAGRGRFCVDSYGDLYGCSKMATITGMRQGVLPFGNVFQGFTRIDNRCRLLVSDVGPRARCVHCEFREACAGGCPAVNYVDTGNIYDPGDLSCRIVFIHQRIDEYMTRRHREVFGTALNASELDGDNNGSRMEPTEKRCLQE